MSDDTIDLRYARATGSAMASLQFIRILARFPQITTMDEIIAETLKAEADIAALLDGEPS